MELAAVGLGIQSPAAKQAGHSQWWFSLGCRFLQVFIAILDLSRTGGLARRGVEKDLCCERAWPKTGPHFSFGEEHEVSV
jgi:hypothetical protein